MYRVWDTIKSVGAAQAELKDAQSELTGVLLANSMCRAKAVELIAFSNVNIKGHADVRLGGGGTTALTPTLSRSGEGEFSAASEQCGSLGLSCGGDGDRGLGGAAARTLEAKSDVRGQGRVGDNPVLRNTAVAMAGMEGVAEGGDLRPKVRRWV